MLKVLVIDESRRRAGELCGVLALAGYQVVATLPNTFDLPKTIETMKPDVILVDTDSPSRDVIEHLAMIDQTLPRPVVMFSDDGADTSIRAAIQAGVAAYVVDGLDAKRLQSVIKVAVARFDSAQALRQQLQQANQKLSERKVIERAKGVLMKTRGYDEEAAFKALRKVAMDQGKPLAAVAKNVVDMAALLL
jgi:response regulator NasT